MTWKTGLIAIAVAFIAVVPLSGHNECALAADAPGKETRIMVSEQWLSSVTGNDLDTAISLARKLVPETVPGSIPQQHLKLAEHEGIKGPFFTAPFNFWDFELWRYACFFHHISRDITNDDPNNIKALFQTVVKKVKPDEKGFKDIPWPYVIWQRGYGVCDRQAWVFCELAYQMGWETQVVYLWDNTTKTSPHTIAEIRKGQDVYFVDVYRQVLFKRPLAEVADDDALLRKIWKLETLWRGIKTPLFWTPSYPQDYCPRNQKLHAVLKESLKNRCPRFGAPPNKRLSAYRELGQKTVFDKPRFKMQLWFYPFRLLRSDIIRHCRKFGVHFLK